MNIFEFNDMMKLVENSGPSPSPAKPMSGYQQMNQMQGGMLMNHPQGGNLTYGQGGADVNSGSTRPGFTPGDVSGFANYGMEAPPLQDPMAQMKLLAGMAPQQQQRPQQQQGNLMSYLAQLGAI